MSLNNYNTFVETLTTQYRALFTSDPEYAYSAAHTTPEALAIKMTVALSRGGANKDGTGIKRTCKVLGIPYTYKAIAAYLNQAEA